MFSILQCMFLDPIFCIIALGQLLGGIGMIYSIIYFIKKELRNYE
ncbi:MAG: hypothetical protein ACI4UK_08435 [Floccifex sp.]